jgi:hypothetical protein
MTDTILKNIGFADTVTVTQTTFFQTLWNAGGSVLKYGLIIGLSAGLGGLAVAGIITKEKIVPRAVTAIDKVEQSVVHKVDDADPKAISEITEGGEKIIEGVGDIVTGSMSNGSQMDLGNGNSNDNSNDSSNDSSNSNGNSNNEMNSVNTTPPSSTSATQNQSTTPLRGGSSKKTKSKRSKSNKHGKFKKCQSKKCLFTKGAQVYLSF